MLPALVSFEIQNTWFYLKFIFYDLKYTLEYLDFPH